MASSDHTIKLTVDNTQAVQALREVRKEASGLYVPHWCRVPWQRTFVMANALLAPVFFLCWLWTAAS